MRVGMILLHTNQLKEHFSINHIDIDLDQEIETAADLHQKEAGQGHLIIIVTVHQIILGADRSHKTDHQIRTPQDMKVMIGKSINIINTNIQNIKVSQRNIKSIGPEVGHD